MSQQANKHDEGEKIRPEPLSSPSPERLSARRHQTDEDLVREYHAPLAFCHACGRKRPVGHYPHQ